MSKKDSVRAHDGAAPSIFRDARLLRSCVRLGPFGAEIREYANCPSAEIAKNGKAARSLVEKNFLDL
jgi:hypothetical protein